MEQVKIFIFWVITNVTIVNIKSGAVVNFSVCFLEQLDISLVMISLCSLLLITTAHVCHILWFICDDVGVIFNKYK